MDGLKPSSKSRRFDQVRPLIYEYDSEPQSKVADLTLVSEPNTECQLFSRLDNNVDRLLPD